MVETTKFRAENPVSLQNDSMMSGAETVCNSEVPTNMAEMLGFDFSTLSAKQLFQYPCGADTYTAGNDVRRKTAMMRVHSPDVSSQDRSENSEEELQRREVEASRMSF